MPERSGLPSAVRGSEPAAVAGVCAGTRFIESHAAPSNTTTTMTMVVRPTRLVISSPSLFERAVGTLASLVGVLQCRLDTLPAPCLPRLEFGVRIPPPSPRHRPRPRENLGVF